MIESWCAFAASIAAFSPSFFERNFASRSSMAERLGAACEEIQFFLRRRSIENRIAMREPAKSGDDVAMTSPAGDAAFDVGVPCRFGFAAQYP